MKTSQEAQRCYKEQYAKTSKFQIGDWVVVHFPQEETGNYPSPSMDHIGLCQEMMNVKKIITLST